jgi:rhamnulose-1-phosphate aldolase
MTQLAEFFSQLGDAGKRLCEFGAAEGAAGNMSVCVRKVLDLFDVFREAGTMELPLPVPELVGASLIVTGSGCRLRDVAFAPTANLAVIVVEQGGETGKLFTAPDCKFKHVTSEFNSHLAIHQDQLRSRDVELHTVLHAQPSYLTYLSHIPEYQDESYFNRHLYRWQPETILSIPQGIGILPFIVNGSDEQMRETALKMRDHSLVMWAQHGVVARADDSILHALDLIEYAEAAAHYEYLNLSTGGKASGLSPEQVRAICEAWNVSQQVY